MIIKHPVEVGNLRQNTNGTQDRKWSGDDPVCHTSHQVTAAGGNFVNDDREQDFTISNARKLRCRQPVLVDNATMILQSHNDLVAFFCHIEHRTHFLTQGGNRRGEHA